MSQIGALDRWFQLAKGRGQERSLYAKKFRGITPAPIRFTLDVENPGYARLTAETDEDKVARGRIEEGTAQLLKVNTQIAVDRLKALGSFKRGQADAILVEVLPGWGKMKP